jgi:hypothetical protein
MHLTELERYLVWLAAIALLLAIVSLLTSCSQLCPSDVSDSYECIEIAVPLPVDAFLG